MSLATARFTAAGMWRTEVPGFDGRGQSVAAYFWLSSCFASISTAVRCSRPSAIAT